LKYEKPVSDPTLIEDCASQDLLAETLDLRCFFGRHLGNITINIDRYAILCQLLRNDFYYFASFIDNTDLIIIKAITPGNLRRYETSIN